MAGGPPARPGRGPAGWDARHRAAAAAAAAGQPEQPDPAVAAVLEGLPPGRALDVGCGRGRHAVWLAARGWRVTAVDASPVGVEETLAAARRAGLPGGPAGRGGAGGAVAGVVADARHWRPPPGTGAWDLVLLARIRLDATVVRGLAAGLAPGGRLVVLGHAAALPGLPAPPADGGPRDPALRHTPESLAEAATGLRVERLDRIEAGVPGGGTRADLLLVARRPAGVPPPPEGQGGAADR